MTLVLKRKRNTTDDQEYFRQQRRRLEMDEAPVVSVGGISDIAVEDIVFESTEPFNITGHFSDLFVGCYRFKSKVALKRPRIAKNRDSQHSIQKFEQEAQVWRLLRHPHILEFIGIYKSGDHMYLVSPFIENGTLTEYIATHPDADRPRFLTETADALAYLHAMKIIHADVKASNILVSADLRALICDFGLAKWMPSITASQSKGAGTVRWQGPEIWDGAPRCFASDVYAFGITIAEVLTGKVPFHDLFVDAAVMLAVMQNGVRPRPFPTHSPTGESYQRIWNIAARCWRKDPNTRPTMKQVFESFVVTATSDVDAEEEDENDSPPPPGSVTTPTVVISESLRSTPEAIRPEPDPHATEGTKWITFTPAPGRQIGKFQPSKATNQAYGAFSDVKMCEVIYENGRRETAALKRLRPVRLGTQAENTSDIDRE
ncbi:hypothetical protein FRC01_012472, partial [Tulasnella sp. 417]